MNVKTFLALGAALSTLAVASTALAQAAAPAPAAAPVGGPPISGVCTYLSEGAVAGSSAGRSLNERMKQLVAAVQAELSPEGQALQAEAKALQALPAAQRNTPETQKRVEAFQQRYAAFQQKQELRGRELEATKAKQIGVIEQAIQPILNQIATERKCGLMLERSQVYWANPQMDVTEAVVTQLNAKMTSLPPFERERAEQQAAPPAAAPAPAATTHRKK